MDETRDPFGADRTMNDADRLPAGHALPGADVRPGDSTVYNTGSEVGGGTGSTGAGAAAYNSSKAALLKLTEVLQTEVRERSWPVRVCALSPSAMNTPMMDQWNLPEEKMMDPAGVAAMILRAVTLPPSMVLQSMVVTGRTEYFPR